MISIQRSNRQEAAFLHSLKMRNSSRLSYVNDVLLSSDFKFSDFTLKAIVGGSSYSYDYRYSPIRANNLSIPDFYDISNGTGQPETTADASENTELRFLR